MANASSNIHVNTVHRCVSYSNTMEEAIESNQYASMEDQNTVVKLTTARIQLWMARSYYEGDDIGEIPSEVLGNKDEDGTFIYGAMLWVWIALGLD
jgi:hypothetical protein